MTFIAVIDDDSAYLSMMQELLNDEGYRTFTQLMAAGAPTRIAEAQPDLVILDVRMESAHAGLSLLDRLRADQRTCHIPVIVCSADVSTLREKQETLTRQGCAVLEKPFDLEKLLDLVRDKAGPARNANL
jgi:CheY-like chemotaxis protein